MRAARFAFVAFLFTAAAYAGPGSFSWNVSSFFVNEGGGAVSLTVFRSGGSTGTVTVDYATQNGSAIAGVGYVAKSGTLTFNDGETSKNVQISIIDNTTWDGGQTYFNVVLANPTGGATILNSTTYVYIYDNDPPPVLTINDIKLPEGNSGTSPATFTLSISGARSVNVNVFYYTQDGTAHAGSDYIGTSGNLIFTPADTQNTVTVSVIGDTVYEPDEYFYLEMSSNVNMPRYYGICTILNDDPKPVVSANNVSIVEGDSGKKNVTFTFTGNQPLFGYLFYNTVDGTAKAGSDYVAYSGSLYWNGQTQQQLTLPLIIGDTEVEPDETFTLHLTPDNFGANFNANPADVTITILNDDQGLGPATQNVPKGGNAAVILDIGNPPPSPQTIAISVNDPCISAPTSVTLTTRSVSIPVTALSAPCSANVQATLPAAIGGKTFSAGIRTFNPLTVVFDPASPQVYVGQTINVHVTASPLDAPISMPLSVVGDTAEVPASVDVNASGGTFTVKGLKQGTLMINATLPPQNGNGTATLFGNVLAPPTTVTILQLAPVTGPTAGGTNVTFTGANFRSDCTFAFGGVPATNVAYQSATSMNATTPAHVAGNVDVTTTCGSDTYTLHSGFAYVAGAPTISGVTPSFGSTSGGTLVRIAGRDFTSACWAFFDGVPARNVAVNSATEVVASTPAHAAGAVAASLRCGVGSEASLAGAFNYSDIAEPAPVITAVSPLAAAPGQQVTINGSRFRMNDAVTFDATSAHIVSTTPDTHVVTVPTLPLGKVSINVNDGSGHISTTGPIFTVLEPTAPQVATVRPSSVPAGGEIAIDGTGFRDPYTFALGDTPLRLKTWTSTSAVCGVPATLARGTYELHVLNGSGAVAAVGPTVTVTDSGAVITSVTPACATTDGGTTITITGSGFSNGMAVTINGTAATSVTVVDASHINATVPALAPGWATVAVDAATATNAIRIYSPYDPDGGCSSPRPRPARR